MLLALPASTMGMICQPHPHSFYIIVTGQDGCPAIQDSVFNSSCLPFQAETII